MEFLENRRSWENQKPPENRQKSGLFWASPFTMHLVWTLLKNVEPMSEKSPKIIRKLTKGPAKTCFDILGSFSAYLVSVSISGNHVQSMPATKRAQNTHQNWGTELRGRTPDLKDLSLSSSQNSPTGHTPRVCSLQQVALSTSRTPSPFLDWGCPNDPWP